MTFYYSLLAFISGLSFISVFLKRKNVFVLLVITFIVMALISGSRIGVKADYFNYLYIYENYKDLSHVFAYEEHSKEPLYMLFNVVFSNLSSLFFFSLISFLSIGLTFNSYYKYSKFSVVAVLIYTSFFFIMRDMGAIRAGLAYSIFLFSLRFLKDKKALYICLNLLGVCIHLTNILALLFYFAYKIRWDRNRLAIVLISAPLIALTGIAATILDLVSSLPGIGVYSKKLTTYISSDYLVESLGLFDITNIKNLAISAVAILYYNKLKYRERYFELVVLVFILGTVIRVIFYDFGTLAGRGYTIFNTVEPIIMAYFIGLSGLRFRALVLILYIAYAYATMYLSIDKYIVIAYDSHFMHMF